MIKLGEMQVLTVERETVNGVYLKSNKSEDEVLLPVKYVPEKTKIGDKIEVFVYRDSDDRIIATTIRPKLTIGEVGYLKVVELAKIGAFLNWGLEKDLFLPHKEQVGELRVNGEYIVGIYIDKSNRLCATMNLYNILKTDSPYQINDKVVGTVFSLRRGLGALIAVDGKYLGLIHEKELFKPVHIGDSVELRVSQVKEDGKLSLSLRDAPRMQMDKDGEYIYRKLVSSGGQLPFNDDSRPEAIKTAFNMSKGSFKKAIGGLLKKRIIKITKTGIVLSHDAPVVDKKQGRSSNFESKKNSSDSRDSRKKTFDSKKNSSDSRDSGKKIFDSKKNSDSSKKFGDSRKSSDSSKKFGDSRKSSPSSGRPSTRKVNKPRSPK